jgi:hypothetical protein
MAANWDSLRFSYSAWAATGSNLSAPSSVTAFAGWLTSLRPLLPAVARMAVFLVLEFVFGKSALLALGYGINYVAAAIDKQFVRSKLKL